MDAGGTRRESHVEPVVHQNRNRHRLDQSPGDFYELTRGGLLQAKLHTANTPANRGGGHRADVAGTEQGIVGHQQEAQGGS